MHAGLAEHLEGIRDDRAVAYADRVDLKGAGLRPLRLLIGINAVIDAAVEAVQHLAMPLLEGFVVQYIEDRLLVFVDEEAQFGIREGVFEMIGVVLRLIFAP